MSYIRTLGYQPIFRPNPSITIDLSPFQALEFEVSALSLEQDLERAGAWVSYCSGSAVAAVIAEVPSITLSSRSFAWEVSRHRIEEIAHIWAGDRKIWLEQIAHAQ